jgi:hypothetical protein
MVPDRDNLTDVAIAAAIIGAAMLAWSLFVPTSAYAQLAVTDPPVEANTGQTWKAVDALGKTAIDIDTQSTTIAGSVTTGGGGGAYTPNSQYISSLDNQLFSSVNGQNFTQNFPGWIPLPSNSTQTAKAVTSASLATYANALATAQSQANELAGEDFSGIEQTSATTTNLLTALQANTEAQL